MATLLQRTVLALRAALSLQAVLSLQAARSLTAVLSLSAILLLASPGAGAAPVSWQEVPASELGRQWWDAGSVHPNRDGNLVVLSRFQPPADPDHPDQPPPSGRLYVSELDCAQELYRDTAINGIPQWRAEWQVPGADDPGLQVLRQVCAAAAARGG